MWYGASRCKIHNKGSISYVLVMYSTQRPALRRQRQRVRVTLKRFTQKSNYDLNIGFARASELDAYSLTGWKSHCYALCVSHGWSWMTNLSLFLSLVDPQFLGRGNSREKRWGGAQALGIMGQRRAPQRGQCGWSFRVPCYSWIFYRSHS